MRNNFFFAVILRRNSMALQVIIASTIFSLIITKKRCKHQPHAVKVWRMATQSQFLLTECIHTIKNPRYLAFLPLRAQSDERMLILCESFSLQTSVFLFCPFDRPVVIWAFVSVGRFYFFFFCSCSFNFLFYFPVIFSLLVETGHSNRALMSHQHD